MSQHYLMVHGPGIAKNPIQRGFDVAEQAGFDINREQKPDDEEWPRFNGNYNGTTISGFTFDISDDREQYERILAVGLGELLSRRTWGDGEKYVEFVDGVIDLACELAIAYDAAYVPLLTSNQHSDIAPTGMPFAEHIDKVPNLAVYSESLLDELGGLEALYGGRPWRYAELDSRHVFAMTADGPWQDTEFTDSKRRDLQYGEAQDRVDISDPFTALEPDEYGTDAVVKKSDIAPEFTNEALTLERVYRDEADNLRRIEDDSFVRRLIDDDGEVGDLPDDADEDSERISALIQGSIPPAFVRLDEPRGETVLSQVMALDIETSKFKLLVSLAQTAQAEDVSDDVMATIDEILVQLHRLDNEEGIDQYIEQRFF